MALKTAIAGTDLNWDTAAHWVGGTIPNIGDVAVIPAGSMMHSANGINANVVIVAGTLWMQQFFGMTMAAFVVRSGGMLRFTDENDLIAGVLIEPGGIFQVDSGADMTGWAFAMSGATITLDSMLAGGTWLDMGGGIVAHSGSSISFVNDAGIMNGAIGAYEGASVSGAVANTLSGSHHTISTYGAVTNVSDGVTTYYAPSDPAVAPPEKVDSTTSNLGVAGTLDIASKEAAAAAAQLATDKAAIVAAKGDIRKDVSLLGTAGDERGQLDVTADNARTGALSINL